MRARYAVPHASERKARMLCAPVLRPARSSKVLLVKNFQTQCSGHLFGDSWVSAILVRSTPARGHNAMGIDMSKEADGDQVKSKILRKVEPCAAYTW